MISNIFFIGTQTNKATPKHTGSNHIILPKVVDKASDSQVSSSDELSYREQPSSEDMSTQTRRRSVEPKGLLKLFKCC